VGIAIVFCVHAAQPPVASSVAVPGNSYYLYTSALRVDKSGVVAVPSRYQWSVETSWRGTDVKGNDLPDRRIALRLYDPTQNFTALTAQMDLETASKLHRDLGQIIARKQQDPNFQYRPQLYDTKDIPMRRVIGIDSNGVEILEDVPNPAAEVAK
jgi:hypothetical protein